jgi:hypothetical protein
MLKDFKKCSLYQEDTVPLTHDNKTTLIKQEEKLPDSYEKFKVGDKVKIKLTGEIVTIVSRHCEEIEIYNVKYNSGRVDKVFKENELELIEEKEMNILGQPDINERFKKVLKDFKLDHYKEFNELINKSKTSEQLLTVDELVQAFPIEPKSTLENNLEILLEACRTGRKFNYKHLVNTNQLYFKNGKLIIKNIESKIEDCANLDCVFYNGLTDIPFEWYTESKKKVIYYADINNVDKDGSVQNLTFSTTDSKHRKIYLERFDPKEIKQEGEYTYIEREE